MNESLFAKSSSLLLALAVSASVAAGGCSSASNEEELATTDAPIRTVALSYPEIERIITDHRATSLEELLVHLPPVYRENFTLVHTSRSLQEGSFLEPRVILFGTNGKLLMALNDNPQHAGAKTLEVLAFDDERQRFDTHRVFFYRPDAIEGLLPLVPDAVYVEHNPQICATCHGSDVRPIFAAYRSWPGFYGDDDDQILYDELADEYSQFLRERRTTGVYRFLQFPAGSPVTPYTRNIASPNHTFRPNLRLGKFTTRLTAKTLARRIAAYPDPFVQQATAYLLIGCRRRMLPDASRARLDRVIDEKFTSVVSADVSEGIGMDGFGIGDFHAPLGRSEAAAVSRLLSIAGVTPSDWSTSIASTTLRYFSFDGSHSIRQFISYDLVQRLGLAEGELAEHFAYESYGTGSVERKFYAELYDPVALPLDEEKAAGACRSLARRIGELGP